jgi:hypothetical protein
MSKDLGKWPCERYGIPHWDFLGYQYNNACWKWGHHIQNLIDLNGVTDKRGEHPYKYDINAILGLTPGDQSRIGLNWQNLPVKPLDLKEVEEGGRKRKETPAEFIRRTGDPSYVIENVKQGKSDLPTNEELRGGKRYASKAEIMSWRERGRGARRVITAEEAGTSRKNQIYGRNPFRDKLLGKEISKEEEI